MLGEKQRLPNHDMLQPFTGKYELISVVAVITLYTTIEMIT